MRDPVVPLLPADKSRGPWITPYSLPSMRLRVLTLAALLSLAAACGGEAAGPGGSTSGSTSITITPAHAVLLTGDTVQLAATVLDSAGNVVTNQPVHWSTTSASATVTSDGRAIGVAAGPATITATADGRSADTQLTVYVGRGIRMEGATSFDSLIPPLMAKFGIPGGAIGVVKDGRLVLVRGYGWADSAAHVPVEPDALFRLASVSKSITSAAVLRLVEQGKLDLDAKAFSFLTDLQPPPGATVDPRLATITVRQLLYHAGGWNRDVTFDPMFISKTAAQAVGAPEPASTETVIRYMKGRPLQFDPGQGFNYSNFGYAVLGRIIERVSGMSYGDYVRTQVLAPMGITHMRLGHTLLADRAPGEVRYYEKVGPAPSVFPNGGLVPWPYGGFYLEAMDSNGGWIASAPDMMRFLTAVDGLSSRPDFLSPQSTATMIARPPAPLWQNSAYWYAMGWQVSPVNGDANWSHDGGMPGTTTFIVRAYNGISWVALFNARSESPSSSFVGELDATLWKAVGAVHSWPSVDLFSRYP
jgi:CubicO group peptidase (beta-lactamase class C family)